MRAIKISSPVASFSFLGREIGSSSFSSIRAIKYRNARRGKAKFRVNVWKIGIGGFFSCLIDRYIAIYRDEAIEELST